MAPVKIIARDYKFEINTGTDAAPVWTNIGGINSFSFEPSKNDVDMTDFDSQGFGETQVSSRSYSMTLDGIRKEDVTDGTRDPGQDAVETLGEGIGSASLGSIRFYHKLSMKGKQFTASANVTGPGGGNDDPAGWSVEFTVSGPVTNITAS